MDDATRELVAKLREQRDGLDRQIERLERPENAVPRVCPDCRGDGVRAWQDGFGIVMCPTCKLKGYVVEELSEPGTGPGEW